MSKNRRLTIEDVAEKAGVSRATVDRVLNRRGGVTPETIQKVERVLSRLRYSASTLDQAARPNSSSVEAIISEGTNPYFQVIRQSIEDASSRRPDVTLQVHGFDPYSPASLVERLREVDEGTDAVIMVGADNPAVSFEIARLTMRGTRVVTIISDVSISDRNVHVGQDSFVAGKTAARLMLSALGGREGALATLIGHLQFRHLLERRAGFEQSIQLSGRDLRLVQMPPYGSDEAHYAEVFARQVASLPDLVGVYLCGGGQPGIFDALRALPSRPAIIAHEITPSTREGLADGLLDAIVAHDMPEVAQKALDAATMTDPTRPGRCGIHIYVHENLPAGG